MHNAEALSVPNGLWKGTAQVLLHANTFNTKPTSPADEAGPPTGTGWATAAQREAQISLLNKDTGQTNPTGHTDTFSLAEYKPADQVLATAPSRANESKVLIKRPPRPKVEVSEHLKLLLLHSSLKPQPAQAAFTPCKQVTASSNLLASACKGVASQIVLKKRPQYAPTVGPATASSMADNAGQAVSQQAICGQQQHGSVTAAQGVKRAATLASAPLQPVLLKRPKLATHGKQQASKAGATLPKAAASKANAASKPAKKAPAGSKAAAKALSVKAVAKPVSLQAQHPGAVPGPRPAVTAVTDAAGVEGEAAAGADVPLGVDGIVASTPLTAGDSAATMAVAAAAAPAKAPRQRKKADDIDLAEVEKKIQDKFAAGKLADLSILELKCFLKARKLPVGGKKSDLVARVEPLLAK